MCSFIYLRAKFKIHHQFETELEIQPYQVLSASVVVCIVVVAWSFKSGCSNRTYGRKLSFELFQLFATYRNKTLRIIAIIWDENNPIFFRKMLRTFPFWLFMIIKRLILGLKINSNHNFKNKEPISWHRPDPILCRLKPLNKVWNDDWLSLTLCPVLSFRSINCKDILTREKGHFRRVW